MIMGAYQLEIRLKDLVNYITDYMRIVIENGKTFTKINFFMMVKELTHEHLVESSERFFKILITDLEISEEDIEKFISSLSHQPTSLNAYRSTYSLTRDH